MKTLIHSLNVVLYLFFALTTLIIKYLYKALDKSTNYFYNKLEE